MRNSKNTIKRILIANRGEIAIRVIRAAKEMGIGTVGIFSEEDRLALHRFKPDQSYQVGIGSGPVEAYLDGADILRAAVESECDALHPGYGFLSENADFAEQCERQGISFIGPNPDVLRDLGNKVEARELAVKTGIPVMPASGPLPEDDKETGEIAKSIGFPLMLKASWGGGGRGMRVIRDVKGIHDVVKRAREEARTSFGSDEVFFEKLVEDAMHIEVQILADHHGNVVHLYERDCSLQRRHQKVIERAPAIYLPKKVREEICRAAVKLARKAGLDNAATVEFLYNKADKSFYFIEVNPRIQVEHTVTEEITGIDIVKAQIRIAEGEKIGKSGSIVPAQSAIRVSGTAIQCRVTAEDPHNNFIPDYGNIIAYRSPSGPGIRLDGGTAYNGAWISRAYDSLLVKVTARGSDGEDSINRMRRALMEFRVRGVATNLPFLLQLLTHPKFHSGDYNTRFIDETPELFETAGGHGQVERLLRFIADVIVNGNGDVKDRPVPLSLREPAAPVAVGKLPANGPKAIFDETGARGLVNWIREQKKPLVTDTTFRDAHQSLLATRLRTKDLIAIAPYYSHNMPGLFSVESWGGATFDVALRFLHEDPWQRLFELSGAMPNIMQQMLLRASNAVGYKSYPDNVVRFFIRQAADAGIDVFRIFDSLNWPENMQVAVDAVGETGKIIEAAICYTGDIQNPAKQKYNLDYYLDLAVRYRDMGAHILGIKDMAGLLKPGAARLLITALKQEIDLPIHLHTHDTSGISAATVLAAVEAGADIVDAAIDSMSGLTSQPNMGAIVAALEHTDKSTNLDSEAIRVISGYWEEVREQYTAFEPAVRSGASEVYVHEMPGGQYTNLREQARSLGIERRWPEIARAYADVNELFGDIVKVTPTSKVVGDMALAMVTAGLTKQDILDPEKEIAFPESVVQFFHGEMGQPVGGFPRALQAKVLNGKAPLQGRPGEALAPVDLEQDRETLAVQLKEEVSDFDLASWLMYPNVFMDYAEMERKYGDVSILPTHIFFYGLQSGEETVLSFEDNRQAIVHYLATSEPDEEGMRRVFFELNGQPQTVIVRDNNLSYEVHQNEKADPANPCHLAAPMPGLVVAVEVSTGERVRQGDTVVVLEAMKMQSAIPAEKSGIIKRVVVSPDHVVDTGDLLVVIE